MASSNNLNPISIYFASVEEATVWADAHPEVYLTIWGETQSGKIRASFVLRKKYEQQNAEAVPAL